MMVPSLWMLRALASIPVHTSSVEASAQGSMETVDMAEDSISYVSSEIAPDLQQSQIQQLIEDAVLLAKK